jgi:hypothetical protein
MACCVSRLQAALSIGSPAAGGLAQSQEKPAVRILIGFTRVRSAVVLGEIMAENLRVVLRRPAIVEYKPCATRRLTPWPNCIPRRWRLASTSRTACP